jgi:hypothetical protein
MGSVARDEREAAFLEQRHLFVAAVLADLGYPSLQDVPDFTQRLASPLEPVVIADYRSLEATEIAALAAAYRGEYGVAHFIVLNPDVRGQRSHPLLEITDQLQGVLPLANPVPHPMEGHPEAVARFGPPDGTLKIYDLASRDGVARYREQAETAEMFDAHNDGLGYGGAVEALVFYADSGPLWGGFTYFQNIVALSLLLARQDPDAFTSLFLPDAVTALRPRGKGAIKVSSPALFMNDQGQPQTFFRIASGEYQIWWRDGCPPLARASSFLIRSAQPFAAGTTFVHFDRRGAGCIVRNGWVVHGRTRFLDGPEGTCHRVLARKWFMSSAANAAYKHVPGMHILARFASIYPERFGPDQLVGEWNFDSTTTTNVRRR